MITDGQRRAYAEAHARAVADFDALDAYLNGEPLPAEVQAVAEVLSIDPRELDWHVEAEHGHEPHDEGYEEDVWAVAQCDDPEHLAKSREAGRSRAAAAPVPAVVRERAASRQPRRTTRAERKRR